MKKSGKGASRRPPGRSPVIAVRVNKPLYDKIKQSAKANKQTMSEEMAALLTNAFEWRAAFSTAKELMAASKRIAEGNIEATFLRAGFTKQRGAHGKEVW